MHSALYYHLEHSNASRCILAITYLLASNASIFCSAPPLGCGMHSRLGRQTANKGTSWRLICASRARSRTDVRLGRASRACSPPICTILRRLIKLVCALLRFRERPRTIEVQRTTSSSQNHRKSLAQYSVVLFIQSVLFKRFNLRVMIHFASNASSDSDG